MASRPEAGRGRDDRGRRDGRTHAQWVFTAAILLTAIWIVVLIALVRWLIVTVL